MDAIKMKEQLESAKHAAREAGRILLDNFGKVTAEYKPDMTLVTRADREAEARIKSVLTHDFPDYSFHGEETGKSMKRSEYTWVVDPLDGTTNYSMSLPVFNTSIALVRGSEPVLGVVFQPFQRELFTAVLGEGAFLNGKPARVSGINDIRKGTICFCHAPGRETVERISRIFREFKLINTNFRQVGSSALELCCVACGRIPAFFQLDMYPYDVAAGTVLVREAGGRVTDLGGAEFSTDSRDLVATNGKVHEELLGFINKALQK